jgi:hypothetical protein
VSQWSLAEPDSDDSPTLPMSNKLQ